MWNLCFALLMLLACHPVAQQPRQPARERKAQRPPRVPLVYGLVPCGASKVVIDGKTEEWPDMRPIPLCYPFQISGGEGYRGSGDIRGFAFGCWDEEKLYLVFQVEDDFLRTRADLARRGYNPSGPVGDGIYLKFDPRRDTRSLGRVPQRGDDSEFWLSVKNYEEGEAFRIDRVAGTIRREKGLELAVRVIRPAKKVKTHQYSIEVAIPWRLILPTDLRAKARFSLGFDAILEDFDDPLDTLPQTRMGWTFAEGNVLYPGNQGTLILLDAPLPKGVNLDPVPRPMPERKVHLGMEEPVFYEDLDRRLRGIAPAPGAPAGERLEVLRELDRRLATIPPLDTGVMVVRWQRFMNREFKGMVDRGIPYFLKLRCRQALDCFGDKIERGDEISLVRLPWSGWLIRSRFFTFAVDPFLPGLHQYGAKVDAQFLTNGIDPLRRNDPLTKQTKKADLPLLSHVPVILPRINASSFSYIRPGDGMDLGAAEVVVLGPLPPAKEQGGKEGKGDEGAAGAKAGSGAGANGADRTDRPADRKKDPQAGRQPVDQVAYDLRFLGTGPRLVFGGDDFHESWMTTRGKAGKLPLDVLALPLSHPRLQEVLTALKPRIFLPQDVLDLPLDVTGRTDLRLADAMARLAKINGPEWRLLAWGESFRVQSAISRMGDGKGGGK